MLCKNMTFDCIQRYFMFCHILCYYPAFRRATNCLQPFVFPISVSISILQYYVVSVSLGFCAFVNKRVSGILRRIKVQNSHLVHAFDKYTRSVGNTHLVCGRPDAGARTKLEHTFSTAFCSHSSSPETWECVSIILRALLGCFKLDKPAKL